MKNKNVYLLSSGERKVRGLLLDPGIYDVGYGITLHQKGYTAIFETIIFFEKKYRDQYLEKLANILNVDIKIEK